MQLLHAMQVCNADTSLLFYSEHKQEVYAWARVIQQTIQYVEKHN